MQMKKQTTTTETQQEAQPKAEEQKQADKVEQEPMSKLN
jgi:hypothetical protein